MRIAFDATYSVDPHPSGIAIYSRELIAGLEARHPADEFIRCYRWKQWRRVRGKGNLLLPPLPTFRADLFHALNQRVDRRPARSVIVTFHDLFVLTAEYSTSGFRKRFEAQARHAAQNADLILAVSEFTAGQVQSLLRVPRSRIRVVPHGVHTPAEPPSPTSRRENIILFVGALQRRKNVKRLVEAFSAVSPNWRLVLAGAPDGYGADEVLQAVGHSQAKSRIEVTGYLSRDSLLDLYGRSAIFAFPSLDEGFGIPVLEAMANGLAVLTSNKSAMPEVAGDAAILVDPEQRDSIADALVQLTENAMMRAELSGKGQKRAQHFSWERTCRETYSVYKELVSSRR